MSLRHDLSRVHAVMVAVLLAVAAMIWLLMLPLFSCIASRLRFFPPPFLHRLCAAPRHGCVTLRGISTSLLYLEESEG